MRRRFNREIRRNRNPEPVHTLLVPALGFAGHRDKDHFPLTEVVNVLLNRDDLETVAAALIAANQPETLSLLRRFLCR